MVSIGVAVAVVVIVSLGILALSHLDTDRDCGTTPTGSVLCVPRQLYGPSRRSP